jgi:hypothetical protein
MDTETNVAAYGRLDCRYTAIRLPKTMKDTPNFAAWSNQNLAKFAYESYARMQEQQETIMQLQRDFKDAMNELRNVVILQQKTQKTL